LFPLVNCFGQEIVSPRIAFAYQLAFQNDKILTVGYILGSNSGNTMYFDGKTWNYINVDTMPTINEIESTPLIPKYSNSLYMTGHFHLWEYVDRTWHKHAVYDSLYHIRRFEQMVELPDSSLLIVAKTFSVTKGYRWQSYFD